MEVVEVYKLLEAQEILKILEHDGITNLILDDSKISWWIRFIILLFSLP